MTADASRIFISYRREETAAHAGRLYDALAARFGDRNVFMDIELEPGIDFVDRITDVVGACDVLLVVMGPNWATIANGGERARISNEEDFVRLEVETALRRRDVRVIPLLVAGAQMPDAGSLPEAMRPLTRRNALELSDLRWRYDVGRLTDALEELLAPGEPSGERGEAAGRPPVPGDPTATAVAERTEAPSTKRFARPGAPTRVPAPSEAPRRTRRWPLLAAGASAAALVALAAILGLSGGGDDEQGDGDGGPPTVSATIRLGGSPDGMAVDGGVVWVTDQQRDVVRRIDAATDEAIGGPIPVGRNPDGVAAEDGIAWVASLDAGTVSRFEEEDGTVTRAGQVSLPGQPESVSLGKQLVWVTTGPAGSVARIDRAEATPVGEPIAVGLNIVGVFVAKDGVWVSDKTQNSVTRLDSATAETTLGPTQVGKRPRGLVEGNGSIWVANSESDSVTRIDASSGRVIDASIDVGDNPRDVTFSNGFVWVANTDSGTVTRINARTGRVSGRPIRVGAKPASVTTGAGSVWVSNSGDGTISRIEP